MHAHLHADTQSSATYMHEDTRIDAQQRARMRSFIRIRIRIRIRATIIAPRAHAQDVHTRAAHLQSTHDDACARIAHDASCVRRHPPTRASTHAHQCEGKRAGPYTHVRAYACTCMRAYACTPTIAQYAVQAMDSNACARASMTQTRARIRAHAHKQWPECRTRRPTRKQTHRHARRRMNT